MRASQLLEPRDLLGGSAFPPADSPFIDNCLVFFRSSDSGNATRPAELSVRAFEVGARGWAACCVRRGRGIVIPG